MFELSLHSLISKKLFSAPEYASKNEIRKFE